MKKVFFVIVLATISLFGNNAFAQSPDYNDDADDTHNVQIVIPEITLLDIEPENDKDIKLTFGFADRPGSLSGAEAGLEPNGTVQDKEIWLNYTSLSKKTRKVTAQITSGTVPSGMTLKVTAATPTTDGAGTKGTSGGEQTLSGTAIDVITGIGSCYTGDGKDKGSKLTYDLDVDNWANLIPGTTSGITVTYTLTE